MEINKIILTNFGSYEGRNEIETRVSKSKNIVLFGGANGAGKTTLFKSIGLGLYGYASLGYASQSHKYTTIIKSLINNKEKQNNLAYMSIEMHISMNNEQEEDNYVLKREWNLNEDLSESFKVLKNNNELSVQEVADFEKYLLSVIPPEMFNMYFFDGEKIADFFTDQDGNKRLKEAFLTICGYDTFDIMSKNFKRNNSKDKQTPEFNRYLEVKSKNENDKTKVEECKKQIQEAISGIKDCDSELELIEKSFKTSGGVTETEWNKKEEKLKQEELQREEINFELKKLANDIVPFIMIKNKIKNLKDNILKEKKLDKLNTFSEIMDSDILKSYFDKNKKIYNDIKSIIDKKNIPNNKVLDLSYEQESNVMAFINKILSFDDNKIYQFKKELENSIKRSASIRNEMNKLSSSNSSDYIETKKKLLNEKNRLLSIRSDAEHEYIDLLNVFQDSSEELLKAQGNLESEIKQESINNISIKAVLMLDKLQELLYKDKIKKLEDNLRKNISTMMTKEDLISEVMIDDNFVLHVYQNEELSKKEIINYFKNEHKERLMYPDYINKISNNLHNEGTKSNKITLKEKNIVPMEIDISTLSAGERQMLILSLYLSLVDLGNKKIPFVIDTPFARMDKTHRINISKYFFSSLKGQVFVLSTNKEIDKEHVKIIGKKVSKFYTLSNPKKSKTTIIKDKYF